MKKGQELNIGLVVILIIAILLLIWGISFMIQSKEKQEGITETFSENVKDIGKTFYNNNFFTLENNKFKILNYIKNGQERN